MENVNTSMPSTFGGPLLLCDDENGMVVYSINDLDDNNDDVGCQKISSEQMMMNMMTMMSERQQRSFGIPLGINNSLYEIESPTVSTRRGERTRIRERKMNTSGSFQILSPVAVHYKPAVKRKEARRSCFRRASSSPASLRAYGSSESLSSSDFHSAPMVSCNNKKKVVRFCDDVRWKKFHS